MCYPAEFGRSRSNGVSVMKEIPLKNVTRLSRSLKVIGTHTDRLTAYDFLLSFHGNPISYRFREKGRFQSKIANFITPCI